LREDVSNVHNSGICEVTIGGDGNTRKHKNLAVNLFETSGGDAKIILKYFFRNIATFTFGFYYKSTLHLCEL
jgi:hypothetical protein